MEQIVKVLLEIKQEIIEYLLQSKEVLSLQQFCKFADISEDYGYKLTSERKIKFYRPGGKRIYIDRADAIAYLKQNPVSTERQITDISLSKILKSKLSNDGNF